MERREEAGGGGCTDLVRVCGEPGHSVECMLSGLESLPNWLLVWADRTGWVMVPGQSRTAEQAHRYYYITQFFTEHYWSQENSQKITVLTLKDLN